MKILIIYIATGFYNRYFEDFYNSLNLFCRNIEKDVFVFTDKVDEYKKYNNIIIKYLRHYPWPINTLFKFDYMNEALYDMGKANYDYICYFNANTQFVKEINKNEFLHKDKCCVCNVHTIIEWGLPETLYSFSETNEKSSAYVPSHEIKTHVAGGFISVDTSIWDDIYNRLNKLIVTDLKNNIIAKMHDQSYLNKLLNDLIDEDKVVIKPVTFYALNDFEITQSDKTKIMLTCKPNSFNDEFKY